MDDVKVDAPSPDVGSLHQADLRRQPRQLSVDGSVLRLAVRPEFRGRRAVLVDVSSGGIGFLLEDSLEPGTVLAFDLQGSAGAGPTTRVARVRHSKPHPAPANAPWLPPTPAISKFFRNMFGRPAPKPATAWLIGCEFDRPLNEEEVRHLIAQLKSDPDDLDS